MNIAAKTKAKSINSGVCVENKLSLHFIHGIGFNGNSQRKNKRKLTERS